MRRTLTAGLVVLAAVVILATPAAAHVTVNPGEAGQGDFTVLNFRVPNERGDASTVELAVQFPEEPIQFVSVRPHVGWTYEITRAAGSDAISVITWRAADGAEIKPGEYDEFSVSVGPLPEVDQLVFPAVQTYSSGEVVRWIDEPPAAGAPEPETPAPVIQLTAAADDPVVATDQAADPAERTEQASAAGSDNDPSDGTARGLAIIALAVGLGAGVIAGLALRRRTREPLSSPQP